MSYFDFEWDTNNVNRTQFNANRGRVEYQGIDKTMTIVSKNVFEGSNIYEFDATYYVSRDGYFTFGACKVDYSNWMSYCHKDQGIGMIGTYMGGGVRQVITLRGKLDMGTKTLHLSRRHSNRTDTVEYNFTHLMSYNGIKLGVSFSDRGDFLELSNWKVTTPQIYGNYGNTPNPIYFAWELNNRNNFNFRIENGTTLRYTGNDQTMTAVSQCVFFDHINEFDVTYWCNKGTHFTLGVVANSFSDFNGYCHLGQGTGMIGTYLGGGERQVIDLHIKIDMPKKELTITRKNNGQSGVYNFGQFGSNGVRFAAACTYRDDFVTIQNPVIYPSSGFNNNYNNNYPITNYNNNNNFPPLNYFEWETNPTNQSYFRVDRKRVDYLGVDKTMTITSRTIFYSDCEFDASYYCSRDGYFTFGVAKPTYTNYLQYCHKDQGIGMIGTYFGGGTRQRIDLRVRIDINRRELTITRKNNGQCGVYNFGHLYSNGIKLAVSFSDNMDFLEIL